MGKKTAVTPRKKSSSSRGIVALLDALGTKNLSIKESLSFIDKITKITTSLKDDKEFEKTVNLLFKEGLPKDEEFFVPNIFTYGDTILLTWEKDGEVKAIDVQVASLWLTHAILLAMSNGLLLRGAITIGDFVKTESVVIGPAIADVASWYEEANWIGIIATPYCGSFISNWIDADEEMKLGGTHVHKKYFFVKYDVPLKDNSLEMWAIRWPTWMTGKPETTMKEYYKYIQKFQIPKGTEQKYYNTEKFVKFCTFEQEWFE